MEHIKILFSLPAHTDSGWPDKHTRALEQQVCVHNSLFIPKQLISQQNEGVCSYQTNLVARFTQNVRSPGRRKTPDTTMHDSIDREYAGGEVNKTEVGYMTYSPFPCLMLLN